MSLEPDGRPPEVWDWPLRAFHWLLVLCVAGSWLTAELGVEYTEWHMRCGYLLLGLLVFRVSWGLLGNRHARWSALLPTPAALLRYLKTLPRREPSLAAGHSPLGVLAVWAILALLTIQAVSGLFVDDDIIYTGPYQPAVSGKTSAWLTNLHHANFDRLLILLGAHLFAMAFYLFYKRHNLVKPMLTGRDPHRPIGAMPVQPTRWWRAVLAIVLAAGAVALLLYLAPEPDYDDYF